MLKKIYFIGSTFLILSLFTISAFAIDYSSMTTDELAALRGTCKDDNERKAFRAEWRERLNEMSVEDRQKYRRRANKRRENREERKDRRR